MTKCLCIFLDGKPSLLSRFGGPFGLERLGARLGAHKIVPPPEAARVVANKFLMVNIVVFSACPEREKMMKAPWELVAGVCINSLEKAADDPEIHGENMEVSSGHGAEQDRRSDGTKSKTHDLNRRSVFCGETEWRRVLVMDLVYVLVEEGGFVHQAMCPVVPGVFHDKEYGDLKGHLPQWRERDRGLKTKELSQWVEKPEYVSNSKYE
jgi:hypothetical protein